MLILSVLILSQLLFVFLLELLELLQILQILLVSFGISIVLVLSVLILSQLLLVFLLELLELLQILQVLLICIFISVMLLFCFFIILNGFFVGGLFILVLLLILLELLLGSLIKSISLVVVILHSLVVVIHDFVVIVDGLVVIVDTVIVLTITLAVVLGSSGDRGQIQVGIFQLAAGNSFIALCCSVVAIFQPIVGFCCGMVLLDGLLVAGLDGAIGGGQIQGQGSGGNILVNGGNGNVVNGEFGDIGGVRLVGQCHGHSHGHGQRAAGLCVVLLVDILSHNFNLLKIVFGDRNTGGWATITDAVLGPWLCVPSFRMVCRFSGISWICTLGIAEGISYFIVAGDRGYLYNWASLPS